MGVLGSYAGHSRLVGRSDEWETVRSFLREVRRAGGAPLLVTGEPGAGRSALLAAAGRYATGDGFLVLPIEGAEFETAIGGSGVHQLLLQMCAHVGDGSSARSKAICAGLRVIAEDPPPVDRLADDIAHLLTDLARDRPVLLSVDDAQWLDPVCAEALARVVARGLTGDAPVGFLAASRVCDHPLLTMTNTRTLRLEPLSGRAAEVLLASSFPGLAGDRLTEVLEAARGNPLALLVLARACAETDRWDPRSLPLPYPLVEAFGVPLGTLDARARHLTLVAALDRGGAATHAMAGPADEDFIDGLRDAGPSSMMCWKDARGILFRHPLTARIIVRQADPEDVRAAHHALGRHYAQRPDSLDLAARHLAEAATPPDEEVARLLEDAAAADLVRGDAAAAVEGLRRAAVLSATRAGRTRRISRAALISCEVTGDLAGAEEMLGAARTDDPEFGSSLAGATATAAFLLLGHGDIGGAHRVLTASIEDHPLVGDANDPVLTDALITLHTVCFYGGRAELWGPYRRAVERLGPAAPPVLRICTYSYPDPARAPSAVRAELLDELAVLGTGHGPRTTIGLAKAAGEYDELARCRPALTRIADQGRRGNLIVSAINAMYLLALDDLTRGNWADCRKLLTEAVDLAERHHYPTLARNGQCHLARLAAAEGNDVELSERLDDLEHWALPRGLRSITMHTQYARALAASGRGDFRAAYRHAEMLGPPGTFPPFVSLAPLAAYELIEAAVRTGQHEAARAHARALGGTGLAARSSRSRLIVATCAALAADDTPAIDDLRTLLAAGESSQWPFDRARGQYVVGTHLRRHHQISESRPYLADAARTFTELGAAGWAGRAHEELDATAAVRRRASTAGHDALSARERGIAELAVTGLSTKQIAERLGISPRTVSNHLYRVFAKLGVSSRAGLRNVLEP
ncbi:LuxR family transcriptional regulator [Actinoplanes sp. NBRC 14428]|nr:LuxR family transcriptional regulator [Actinoplanes sp. NBRC 14428]